mmetsp:Transcript_35417/g.36081  ORF Transcript_35417/g.36081 Transcript_35417/m.36081 type:complete len:125 (+) Transcript_35417:727-1101(+)
MFGAMIPVFFMRFKSHLAIVLTVFIVMTLIPFVAYVDYLRKKRHVNYYFMKGKERSSSIENLEDVKDTLYDPYDPVVASKMLRTYADLGRAMALRDGKTIGYVENLETDPFFNSNVLANLMPTE